MSQRTCPNCGTDKSALSIERQFISREIGEFSLAGNQMKTSASVVLVIKCGECGWKAIGHIEDKYFVVDTAGVVSEGRSLV
jgi:predicted RNA-binding Zn-ribbon protein involved in translation (DUF1610 family)